MRTILLLFGWLFFSFTSLQAQDIESEVETGPEQVHGGYLKILDFMSIDDHQHFAMMYEKKKYYLESYDLGLKPLDKIEVEMKLGKSNLEFERLIYVKDKLYILTTRYDRKLKQHMLYARDLDPNSLEIQNSKLKAIARFAVPATVQGRFKITPSTNKEMWIITYENHVMSTDPQVVYMSVLDNNLEPIWDKLYPLGDKGDLFRDQDWQVDSEGHVYVIGRKYTNYRASKYDEHKEKEDWGYDVYKFDRHTKKINRFPLKIGDNKKITGANLYVDADDRLTVGGLYSTYSSRNAEGTFIMGTKTDAISFGVPVFNQFRSKIVTRERQNMGDYRKKPSGKIQRDAKHGGVWDYYVKDIVQDDKGNFLFMLENYFSVMTETADGDPQRLHSYCNIIVDSYSKDYEHRWDVHLVKWQKMFIKQNYKTDLSYKFALEAGVGTKIFYFEGGNFTLTQLDENGKRVGNEVLYNASTYKYFPGCRTLHYTKDNFYSIDRRKKDYFPFRVKLY
jgi:hypothetical protein